MSTIYESTVNVLLQSLNKTEGWIEPLQVFRTYINSVKAGKDFPQEQRLPFLQNSIPKVINAIMNLKKISDESHSTYILEFLRDIALLAPWTSTSLKTFKFLNFLDIITNPAASLYQYNGRVSEWAYSAYLSEILSFMVKKFHPTSLMKAINSPEINVELFLLLGRLYQRMSKNSGQGSLFKNYSQFENAVKTTLESLLKNSDPDKLLPGIQDFLFSSSINEESILFQFVLTLTVSFLRDSRLNYQVTGANLFNYLYSDDMSKHVIPDQFLFDSLASFQTSAALQIAFLTLLYLSEEGHLSNQAMKIFWDVTLRSDEKDAFYDLFCSIAAKYPNDSFITNLAETSGNVLIIGKLLSTKRSSFSRLYSTLWNISRSDSPIAYDAIQILIEKSKDSDFVDFCDPILDFISPCTLR